MVHVARTNDHAVLWPLSGGQKDRGRSSVPSAALSGPIPKVPGFTRGSYCFGTLVVPFRERV
jgi:hypothetical protein